MGSEIPEWAMEEARVALISHPGKSDPRLERVARALVAAERRGIERAAQFHDEQADQFEKAAFQELSVSRKLRNESAAEQHRNVAAAIRQLGDTP